MDPFIRRRKKTYAEMAQELGETGLCVCADFISAEVAQALRNDAIRLRLEGRYHRAGVGHGSSYDVRPSIRRDEIFWLEREESKGVQQTLWAEFDELKSAFNRNLFLGLNDFEGHYAMFEAGGFYARHRDSFGDTHENGSSRLVSLVLYLNENWQPTDGGQLRIYSGDSFTDVNPTGGTLVGFMSRESEHEVLPSTAKRLSFAGWFGRRIEKSY